MTHKPHRILNLLFLITLVIGFPTAVVQAAPRARENQQGGHPTPAELIAAVNQLRLNNGLNALNTHPALMEAAQWEAETIADGAPGHTHPPGLTLGQWLLTLGYPLAGSIPQDGLRSENWVAGTEMTPDEAVQIWLGDAPHTNTMLSPSRSDIGAGVAVRQNNQGKPVYTYVLETALQTSSGEMQPEAVLVLTAIPQTQSAVYSDPTQAAAAASVPQHIVPVTAATARPDGDVIHEVQHGQTLWAIAIEYGVKIIQIKRLNNLNHDDIWQGQQLLVQKSATQPAPTNKPSATPTPSAPAPTRSLTPSLSPTPTGTPSPQSAASSTSIQGAETDPAEIPTLAIFLGLVVLIPAALILMTISEHRRSSSS